MDNLTKSARSKRMSLIRGQNTKPELLVRQLLYKVGYRYRINAKNFPGKPDLLLPKYRTAIFIHGCFWHGHECHIGHIPKSNIKFWQDKITSNKNRDTRRITELNSEGWRVLTIWECSLLGKTKFEPLQMLSRIEAFLEAKNIQNDSIG